MLVLGICYHKDVSKYTPKRTKLHYLRNKLSDEHARFYLALFEHCNYPISYRCNFKPYDIAVNLDTWNSKQWILSQQKLRHVVYLEN